MLETAIVGAGPCGLALAYGLHRQGKEFALFEARRRLGGRVLTVTSAATGQALDLGPTWFWPDTQPRFARLLNELGLRSFPQHDTGEVLHLLDHDRKPEVLNRPELHGGAHCLEGGMARLIEALSRDLPGDAIQLEHVLTRVVDRGDHVVLQFDCGESVAVVRARRVVLALPPRLVEERVEFQPPLDESLRAALGDTYTWMASQAKAMVAYDRPFWREQGHSGNAFVQHAHAVLGEIFDACDASGHHAALGGFFSLPAELRVSLREGMPMLLSSQLVQVFGSEAEHGEPHVQDWAAETYTCTARDLSPPPQHPEYGHPALRPPQWGGKLHFGGSETASYGGGYLEGALESAARIQRALMPVSMQPHIPVGALSNDASLAHFGDWVSEQKPAVFERYRLLLQQNLTQQTKEQLTQRAVLAAMEQVYSEALAFLECVPFDTAAVDVQQGRSGLTPHVLAPFAGFNKTLLEQVVAYNRSSCAISNFPDEHEIPPDYLETIARDLAAAWQEFALGVNYLLLTKATGGRVAAA